MRALLKFVLVIGVLGVGYAALPEHIRLQLPGSHLLTPVKELQTVSLEQAMAAPRAGYVTVTFLYLSVLPPNVASELSSDVRAWRKKGVAVRGFAIDPVPAKGDVAKFVHDIGLDIPPTWIEMPDGAACAFNQMEAVKYFTKQQIDPRVTVPLLHLALTDRDGQLLSTYAITAPNGGAVDPTLWDNALMSFNNSVVRAVR
jgi:hypothetical protein